MAAILLVGPQRHSLGGVTSHLDLLFASSLAREYQLTHFAVGAEGSRETRLRKLARVARAPLRFAAALRRSNAALVHLNPSMDQSFWRELPLLLAARLMGRRVVLQIHGGLLPEQFCAGAPGASWLVRAALRAADRLVLLARAEQSAYDRFVGRPMLALIPNAIDPAPYAGAKPDPYDGTRPLRAVYLGRIVRSKGLFDACDAVAAALRAGARIEFLIAGDGPDRAALAGHVAALGLEPSIRLVGALQGAAKARFLLEGDVFLFPTRHPEGLPYALLEAMAAATPPLTTPAGAIPDVVTDGRDGLLLGEGDIDACAAALAGLAGDPGRVHALARAARERVSRDYSLARLERDFHALYRELLAARQP